MNIKQIVVTYDFSDETHQKFLGDAAVTQLLNGWRTSVIRTEQELFMNLSDLGVHVGMIRHTQGADVQGTVIDLEEKLAAADLVFHRTPDVAIEMDKSHWKEQYQTAIEDLVHDHFIRNAHFIGEKRCYTDKQTTTSIAKSIGLPQPQFWSVDDYFSSQRALPVVLKHKGFSQGHHIFFIDKAEQIDRFFNAKLYVAGISPPPNPQDYVVQEYVETPSNHFTSYRIFTVGDGTILGAVLTVSKSRKDRIQRIVEPGPFLPGRHRYRCVDSPVYMDCFDVVSNHSHGGSQIPFDANDHSRALSEMT